MKSALGRKGRGEIGLQNAVLLVKNKATHDERMFVCTIHSSIEYYV